MENKSSSSTTNRTDQTDRAEKLKLLLDRSPILKVADEEERRRMLWLNEQRRIEMKSPLVRKKGSHNKRKHVEDKEDSPSQFTSDVVGKKLKGVSHLEPPSTEGFINLVQQELKSLGGLDFGEKPKKERIFKELLRALYSLYCADDDDLDECEKLKQHLEESEHHRGELEYELRTKDGEVASARRRLNDLLHSVQDVAKEAAMLPDLMLQLREVNEQIDEMKIEKATQKSKLEIAQVELNAEKRKVATMEKEAVAASAEYERQLKLEYMKGYDESTLDLVSRGLLTMKGYGEQNEDEEENDDANVNQSDAVEQGNSLVLEAPKAP